MRWPRRSIVERGGVLFSDQETSVNIASGYPRISRASVRSIAIDLALGPIVSRHRSATAPNRGDGFGWVTALTSPSMTAKLWFSGRNSSPACFCMTTRVSASASAIPTSTNGTDDGPPSPRASPSCTASFRRSGVRLENPSASAFRRSVFVALLRPAMTSVGHACVLFHKRSAAFNPAWRRSVSV